MKKRSQVPRQRALWVGGGDGVGGAGTRKPGENERRVQPMFAYVVNNARNDMDK